MPPRHLLVISLGNPLPKYDSLHSAGHFALHGLSLALRQPLHPTHLAKQPCHASRGSKYTLVQSPTLMNVSGPFVAKVFHELSRENELGLVIVHDDLEREFGAVRAVPWERSHRGHNGIKSVRACVSPAAHPGARFARIAVGIGRPEARDSATVSRYVLGRIPGDKRRALENEAALGVAQCLLELEDEWSGT